MNRVVGQIIKNEIYGEGVITKISGSEMEVYLYDSPYRDQDFIHDDVSNALWESTRKRRIPVDQVPRNCHKEEKHDYSYRMAFYLGL